MILLRKHILSKFSKTYDYQRVNNNYYDEVTQVSYNDKIVTSDIANKEWTGLTETIENSDPDEFICKADSRLTFTVENSDPDEFRLQGPTVETAVVENSDADEFNFRGWSEETRMLENSDADEFVC